MASSSHPPPRLEQQLKIARNVYDDYKILVKKSIILLCESFPKELILMIVNYLFADSTVDTIHLNVGNQITDDELKKKKYLSIIQTFNQNTIDKFNVILDS